MSRPVGTKTDFVVLGAGRPTGFGGVHGGEAGTPDHASLRWVRDAVEGHVETCHFVAGFAVEQTAAQLGGFSIEYNSRWQETGSVASLLCAPLPEDRQALVSYADIVFRSGTVERLLEGDDDVAIAIDSGWRERYTGRTEHDIDVAEKVRFGARGLAEIGREVAADRADAEFVGLARFSAAAMAIVRDPARIAAAIREKGSLADLIGLLAQDHGLTVTCHDVKGDWAELNAPQDLARFVLGTKAETLDRLRPLVRVMRIEEQVRLTVAEWDRDPSAVLERVAGAFRPAPVIVRSSARSEDSWATANAGAYSSIPNVSTENEHALRAAIDEVIASYGMRRADDQVLVQPMLTDVVANGVVFTRTLSHGAPYFVVNYDETPGCTDAVTAGKGELRILYMHHDARLPPSEAPEWTATLIEGARELIRLVGYDTLDMEFVVGANGAVHLLQLRPISVDHAEWVIDDGLLKVELDQAVARYRALETPPGFLGGGQAIFGVMPDWNPAEIIGTRPGLLSVSLYRYLICDEVWARQRAEYGYHDVRPQPLLVSFAGHPYVNVRASLRSFVPAAIPEELAERLVTHCLARLISQPALHDKVEFNIAFTCLSFDYFDRANAELQPAGFTPEEVDRLREGLVSVTRNGIARCAADLEMVERLRQRFGQITARSPTPLERACALLEDCRQYGTLPFAHLARGGFVAVTLLRSAVRKGFIDQAFLDRYLGSIATVAKQFVTDGARVAKGTAEWESYLDRYGHLRPGTYDITSPAYRDNEGHLLRDSLSGLSASAHQADAGGQIEWPADAWPAMQAALAELGLETTFEEFDRFVRGAIEGREYAKFVFSRNLSQALDDIAEFGRLHGLDRETLAAVPIDSLFALRAGEGFGRPEDFIRMIAAQFEQRRHLCRNIELPPLIHDAGQFHSFFYPPSEPNFITSIALTRDVRWLKPGEQATRAELAGRIVVISQADPGYDWLFGCDIAGLVTQYGGANSHMAIRAAEFGTPAAIGVGEVIYERLQKASLVRLDCLNRKVDIIR